MNLYFSRRVYTSLVTVALGGTWGCIPAARSEGSQEYRPITDSSPWSLTAPLISTDNGPIPSSHWPIIILRLLTRTWFTFLSRTRFGCHIGGVHRQIRRLRPVVMFYSGLIYARLTLCSPSIGGRRLKWKGKVIS